MTLLPLSLAMAMSAHAWLYVPPAYEMMYYEAPRESASSPYWTSSPDAYHIRVRLPELEPTSVTAALAADGKKIEITGERKIDGCTCQPTMVKEISLPYRPRPEDVDVSVESDVLSLKLARHAKGDAPTPLAVKSVAEEKALKKDGQEAAGTRPLTFVPHASAAAAPSLDEQEKNLTDKFKSVGLAAVAVSGTPSAKEAAATAAEQQGDIARAPVDAAKGDAAEASTAAPSAAA